MSESELKCGNDPAPATGSPSIGSAGTDTSAAAAAPRSSPSSFVSASTSSSDSPYHRIAVLLCPGCRYLEFPGCLMHNGLLANIKGNGYMSCVACELDRKAKGVSDVPGGSDNLLSMVCATDSAEPWSVACQHCNAVKADTIPWIICDSEAAGLSTAASFEKEDVMPHTVIQCEQCKTSIFPLVNSRLTRRHPTDPMRLFLHPADPDTSLPLSSFPFRHYIPDCRGSLVPIPILISKLESKFVHQALPASPYLPIDSSFVPGFIPPIEWITGKEHKAQMKQRELRKEKYVLSRIGHRTPVWRDKAFIGVFGDPYVRDTELEGGHIAESIDAMHFILSALYRSSGPSSDSSNSSNPLPFDFSTASWFSTFNNTNARSALKQVIDTIRSSMDTIHYAKDALDALVDRDLKDSDKQQFIYRVIRNWRRKVRDMKVGEVLILPGGWIAPKAGHAIMHIIYRYEASYSFVTCNTGGGLTYHPSSVSDDGAKMLFRTSIRIDGITPTHILDDAFWLVFWRLQTVQSDDHDHHVLYEILLPTLAAKPLAEAITPNDPHAEWRTPQRSGNCYLKCVLECIRYLSRSFGMTKPQTKQSSFAVRRLFMTLCMYDLAAHERALIQHPDSGDDKDRRKREATKLQAEMKEEKVPEKRKKDGPAASNPANPSTLQSRSTIASIDLAKEVDLPRVDIPAEPLDVDTTPMHDESDLTMIRLSTKQTAHAAIKEAKSGRLDANEMKAIYDQIQSIEAMMAAMPIHVLTSAHIQPKLNMSSIDENTFSLDSPAGVKPLAGLNSVIPSISSPAVDSPSPFLFPGFDTFPLLVEESTRQRIDQLAGALDPEYQRKSTDFRGVFCEIKSIDDIIQVFERALQVCVDINAPQCDSLNGYYQLQALIQGVLTYIPLPGSAVPSAACWFTRGITYHEQRALVRTLWRLGKLYLSAEFSLESPAFVSGFERTIVMWALVTHADWVMRRTPADQPIATPLTQVLNGADGAVPFYMFDLRSGGGQHVRDMVRHMECGRPELAHLYGELVEYWNELETSAQLTGLEVKYILPFSNSASHQTTMFQEDDSTLNFVRDIANVAGYIIEKRGYAGKESSEIESVARWLFAAEEGDYSVGQASFGALIPQLARDQPEFANLRDLHFLFKLSLVHTHPTARVVLPGRYSERDATIYWTTQGMPMSNSMVIIYAKAFSKKEILLIKTRTIDSYATPDAYLPASAKGSASNSLAPNHAGGLMGMMGGFGGFGASMAGIGGAKTNANAEWTEEDVIHNTVPALFDNLLSLQSSEHIMCILTAPYLRIPLILSFFANQDRVDLLADRKLGKLLSAVLFETGAWASRFHEEDIEQIPFATTPAQSAQQPASNAPTNKTRIGSPYGLLLNELCSAAGATLNPFLSLLTHVISLDTGYFSPASSTCRLTIFVALMSVKMESFLRYTLHQIEAGAIKSASQVNTQFMMQAHTDLLHLLLGPILNTLMTYKSQAMNVIAEAVWVMAAIARVCACGVTVPSYAMNLTPSSSIESSLASSPRRWTPAPVYSPGCMVELLGSFSFVLTWHSMGIGIGKNLSDDDFDGTWNKSSGASPAASGQDLLAQFAETMQQTMNASKLKKMKNEDAKEKEKASKPPIDEMALFQSLQSIRGAVLAWFDSAPSVTLDSVFDALVEWVHGHKLTDVDVDRVSANPQLAAKKPQPATDGASQWRPANTDSEKRSGRFVSETRRLEIDLQTASITFYDHDVFPVHDLVARHEDFLAVFGNEPQHYAMIRSQEHRQEYGIFGGSYTLHWWDRNLGGECVNQPVPAKVASDQNINAPGSVKSALPDGNWRCGAKSCAHVNPFSQQRCELCHAYQPMLSAIERFGIVFRGLPFTRRYGSTYLAPSEAWIVRLIEPLLRTLFSDELDTLNYSLWMRTECWTEEDEKVCLFALDAQTFKQIILYRSSQLVECYNLVEHGRVLYRSLVFTSNGRLSLSGLPAVESQIRMKPWEAIDRFANGDWEEVQKREMSFTMKRVRQLAPTIAVTESFICPTLLIGLMPKVIIEHYHFYLVEDINRQIDHTLDEQSDTLTSDSEFDWFGVGDILGFVQPQFKTLIQWNFDLHIKLIPNGVTSTAAASEMKSNVDSIDRFAWDRFHAVISQVTRGSAGAMRTTPLSLTPGPAPSPSASPTMQPTVPSLSISPDQSPSMSPSPAPVPAAPFHGVLLNLMTAPPGSFLAQLAQVLIRIEDLSHILVFSRTNDAIDAMRDRRRGLARSTSAMCDASYRITHIDLPRLKLSFRPRRVQLADGSTIWRLFSNDHAGFYISDTSDPALDQLLRGIPNSILLENDRRELALIVPNTPLRRPQILSCPFSNELIANRSHATWLATINTRFNIYPVHVSHTFLLANTLASTFYLLLLSLLSRNYSACAIYCDTCEIDTGLTAEERFVFNLFEETLHDQHPDAHAIRLKLYVCIWLSGDSIEWKTVHGEPWALEEEYSNYCKKLMHVSATCRLTNEEEEAIYQQIAYEEGQKKESPPSDQQNRATIRAAIAKHLAIASASSSASVSPEAVPASFKPPRRDGLTTVWWKWQAQLAQYLSAEWSPGLWAGMLCYERPTPIECANIDLLDTIGDALNDTMIGSMHKRGFLFLLDAILGGIDIRVDTSSSDCADCSFSLGRMLTQWHFLKTTKFGEEVKPQPNYLPFAVNAVFGSGLIPTRNNDQFRTPVYSIPAFPPLPEVPVAGMESALSKGFLLHRKGTPIYQFFVLLSQWSRGFVQMCREWSEMTNRPTMTADPFKSGAVILAQWTTGRPTNAACDKREIRPFEEKDACALSEAACISLATTPLQSINLDRFLVDNTVASSVLSNLPFDVSSHPASLPYVAKSMLKRMAHDMGEYANQVSTRRTYQLNGITFNDLDAIALTFDDSRIDSSIAHLNDLHRLLIDLRASDWSFVHRLRVAIDRLANSVPDLATAPSIDTCKFVLSRYAGQSFQVKLDYLTALLLSTQPEKDLHELNPHLPSSSVPELLRLVATLLLVNNRVGFIDRLVFEIDELRASLRSLTRKVRVARASRPAQLARSLSGGAVLQSMPVEEQSADPKADHAAAEIHELTQQIGLQSSTLADNLLAARHYMAPSDDASGSYVFDPRFLVFEYVFNIMLRKMQIDLIMSFAKAAWSNQSLVQQMIMGAGKTSVVGPLLALMLADGKSLVTMVVPSALLPMSRSMLRARFSAIIPKRIHTFEYDRSTKDDPRHVAKLLYKMNQAKAKQGIVIATAVSVKSMMLKYLELLVSLQTTNYDPRSLSPFDSQQIATKSLVIDGLAQIMAMWRDGTLILDEIDLLLHPLKSELNFPCGNKVALQPAPNRWNYPMHLLDAFFYAETGYLSIGAFHELPEAQAILAQLQSSLARGHASQMVQMLPHLILLNGGFYHSDLKPILAKWSLIWLKAQGLAADIPDAILLEYMTVGWQSSEVRTLVTALLNKTQMVLLNLAHSWLNSYLLHVLSKINRVSYGLLKEDELVDGGMSLSRRLVAIPFLAKDVPSRSSEFAHSEVLIGLTILAYKIEGMRVSDLRHCVSVLKNSLAQEMGPEHARPSARLFKQFVEEAKQLRRAQIERSKANKAAASSSNNPGVRFTSSVDPIDIKILPLSQFSMTDPTQLLSLYQLLRFLPRVLAYYLDTYLFPTCLTHHLYNLSASGQELGNGMLFKVSLGFSGTPSDLLPLELGKCEYERGADGKVVNILTSPTVVTHSIKSTWSVRSLLIDIARHRPPFHSLIDTGALITGMSNQEVAEFLLSHGLDDMDGVLFLDHHDDQMILLRTGGAPIPASQCGIAMHKRFSFYDQVHSTGIDIKHAMNAVAVMTLGKDMTFRDYAQGAFRMRQIGQGQKIHLFVIPEVLKLIERELKFDSSDSIDTLSAPNSSTLLANLPVHVAAWLTINSMRMEQLQFFQLCLQNLHSVWRKQAFRDLLIDSLTPSEPALQSKRHLRFDLSHADTYPHLFWLLECINLFKQPISFDIEDHIPVHKPFFASLKTLLSQHTTFIKEDQQCLAIASVLNHALEAAQEVIPKNAYDKEMVNEQEREQEQEKHQEVLKDPRAQRNDEDHQPWSISKLRETEPLLSVSSRLIASGDVWPTTNIHPFYPTAAFALDGRPLPLALPRYMLMSHAYFRQAWAINPKGHRRLKNIYVILEWCPPRKATSTASTRPFIEPVPPTPEQSDRWARLFGMFDVNCDGVLSTPVEFESLRRVLSVLLDEEVPESFFPPNSTINQKQIINLLQAVTKAQDATKVAGFTSEAAASATSTQLVDETAHEEDNRFFVILPLDEAQALRRAVHTSHPLFRAESDVQFALWSLDGHIIETTPHYQHARRKSNHQMASNYQTNLSIQLARFINGDLYYTSEEIVSLLRCVGWIHPADRRELLSQILLARHRDHRTITKTPIEKVMQLQDEIHYFYMQALIVTIRHRIDAKGMSLLQAFHLFDIDGNGLLDPSELWTAMHFLGLVAAASPPSDSSSSVVSSSSPSVALVSPSELIDFLRLSDHGADGALDFEEFAAALRTREEAHMHGHHTDAGGRAAGTQASIDQPNADDAEHKAYPAGSSASSPAPHKLPLIPIPAIPTPPPPTPFRTPPTQPHRPPPQPTAVTHTSLTQAPTPAAPATAATQVRSPPVASATPWPCAVCTYENSAGRSRCEMCDTPKA